MKYHIEWWENKTSAKGNKYATVSLKDETGKITTDIAVFASFPNFENLKAGEDVEGELKSKDYQGKTSYTLEVINAPAPRRAPAAITKAMELKAQNIEKAQTNKELGIMTSSTIRMAVDITLAFMEGETIKDISSFKGQVRDWRKWLIAEWDNIEAPPFN